ncbi:hypothetical protein VULLAG_LOCUS15827 [Vulpes lagopus]
MCQQHRGKEPRLSLSALHCCLGLDLESWRLLDFLIYQILKALGFVLTEATCMCSGRTLSWVTEIRRMDPFVKCFVL